MEIENQNNLMEEQNLNITPRMQNDLLGFAKWLKFLSVLGVIGVVLMIIASVVLLIVGFVGSALLDFTAEKSIVMGVIYLAVALLYVYPFKKAFGFIRKIRQAFSQKDNLNAEEAFQDLRQGMKFIGILTIVCLVLYVLILVVVLVAASVLANSPF